MLKKSPESYKKYDGTFLFPMNGFTSHLSESRLCQLYHLSNEQNLNILYTPQDISQNSPGITEEHG